MTLKIAGWAGLIGILAAGCVSLAARAPVRPAAGQSGVQMVQDQARCQQYALGQARHREDHYVACMIASGYAVNWDLDELDWVIGVMQTRAHDAPTVMTDLAECDRQADNAKKTTTIPPLPPDLERVVSGETTSPGFEGFNRRPLASRMLVACLLERGYAVTPRVPYDR